MSPQEFMARQRGIKSLVQDGDDDFLVSIHWKKPNQEPDVMTPDWVICWYVPTREDPYLWDCTISPSDCENVRPWYDNGIRGTANRRSSPNV